MTESHEVTVTYRLNGQEVTDTVPTSCTLLDLLRGEHGCQGVRASCERGVCGACTVLVDDLPIAACSTFAFDVADTTVETVEGLADHDGSLSPQQQAFTECGGFQCGYCTSGMLMLTTGLLRQTPRPTRPEIRDWISSNTCRCTGYEMILESVERASELSTAERKERSA